MATDTWKAIADVGIAVGGVLPYIPQYAYIRRTGDANGFSPLVCLILLVANSLRVLFYLRRHFDIALLCQSIVMCAAQLIMLELCVRKRREVPEETPKSVLRLTAWTRSSFWKWTYFQDYLAAMALFLSAMYLLTSLFPTNNLYTDAIGTIALGLEACLGMPQLLQNYRQGSTAGLSIAMVLGWTFGDVFKTAFAFSTASPIQFDVCGVVQLVVDAGLLVQIALDKWRQRRAHPAAVVPFARLES